VGHFHKIEIRAEVSLFLYAPLHRKLWCPLRLYVETILIVVITQIVQWHQDDCHNNNNQAIWLPQLFLLNCIWLTSHILEKTVVIGLTQFRLWQLNVY